MNSKKAAALILTLCCCAFLPFLRTGFRAQAANAPEIEGMVLKKTAAPAADGKYRIALEAYTTAARETAPAEDAAPCDIIFVVDQSGTMGTKCCTAIEDVYVGVSVKNSALKKLAKNEKLLYKTSDGTLVNVTVKSKDKTYTYSYTLNGVSYTIETSTGSTTIPNSFFYKKIAVGDPVTRREAVMFSLGSFTDIMKNAGDGNINNRVAMVGFANGGPGYINTELFIGRETYNYSDAAAHYAEAFQSLNTEEGRRNIDYSVNSVHVQGSTFPRYGLEMAKRIFDVNPIPDGEERWRVVIMFTDGEPDEVSENVAQSLYYAKELKNIGATVYTVGVIDGADPTNGYDHPNDFMHKVSSNYGTDEQPAIDPFPPTASSKSYYFAANDGAALRNIFESIANELAGNTPSPSDTGIMIKDIVAEYFTPPQQAEIELTTAACTGVDAEGKPSEWANAVAADSTVTASVTGNTVNVTGFNYSENWCGMENNNIHGKKLIIEFNVTPKPGFLGGNSVPTNGDTSGVYANQGAASPLITFEVPKVDVPIPEIAVDAPDKNIYLYGALTEEPLKAGVAATVGDNTITIKLDESDFGLEPWQYKFVNIIPTVSLGSFTDLTEDGTYTVSVAITPKTAGMATAKSASANGNINVFKPEITFSDKEVWYGDNADGGALFKYETEKWKHNSVEDTDVEMIGAKPQLTYTYTPDEKPTLDAASPFPIDFYTDKYVRVKVEQTVGGSLRDIAEHTKFNHAACSIVPNCPFNANNGQFMLHVKTCELTVTKNVVPGTTIGGNESFVFTVTNGSTIVPINLDVVVHGEGQVTVKGLPIGNYTVTEDSGWSWRYMLTDSSGNTAESALTESLNSTNPIGRVDAYNKLSNHNWLDDEAHIDNRWKKKEGGYEIAYN